MKVSKTGYKKNSKDKNEPALVIPSNKITMKGVDVPVFGVSDTGDAQMMYPGLDYSFGGNYVYELPMAKDGYILPGRYRNPEGNWVSKYASGGDISISDLSRPNWLDKAQKGQQVKYYDDLEEFEIANRNYNDSLEGFKKYPLAPYFRSQNITKGEFLTENNPSTSHFSNILNSDFANSLNISPSNIRPTGNDHEWVYKRPTQKPVYKDKPKEYIPTKTVKLEREPVELVMPQSNRILDSYNNTLQVLRGIQKEDRSDENPYPTKVVPAPTFKSGGWLDKYQDGKQVERRGPNQLFFESPTESDTYQTQYSQPEVTVTPNWTEEELERNKLRDKYIADDQKAFRHWYDKLGYDKDNVTKRANQFAYNKLAKQYLKGDKENLTDEQKKFIGKSEYANRLQPSIGSRFVEGVTNPGFNLETVANVLAPFEYPGNLVRGAVEGEFVDALKGQTPSPYFVSSDLAGTSPTQAAIASGLMTVGTDPLTFTGEEIFRGVGQGAKVAAKPIKNAYNTVATGESFLPVAWKSPAVGLTQSASDDMFRSLANSGKLTPEERALVIEYQHGSRKFTGRGLSKVDQEKRQALNNIIKKYNANIGDDTVLTRMFNNQPDALGATLENGRLNFGDRPTSFTAGVQPKGYGDSVNRIVVPKRYSKNLGDKFLVNQYDKTPDEVLNLLDDDAKDFASWIGTNANLEQERELIGTGLDFTKIGKVKNDIGGYDLVVKPTGSPNSMGPGPMMLGLPNYTHEVKNVDYFKKMLDSYSSNKLSSQSKKYFEGIINSVTKQEGLATKKQYDMLQRLRTGDFNYGKKEYGGIKSSGEGYYDYINGYSGIFANGGSKGWLDNYK